MEESPSRPQRTCLQITEVATCLAAFCLRQNFGVFLKKLLKSLQAAFYRSFSKTHRNFRRYALKFCPRQGQKPFNLKVRLTYRANAPLNRTLAGRKVFTRSLFESLGQAFSKACGIQRQSLWSPSAEGESSFTAFSFCLAFSFVPAKGKRKSAVKFPKANTLQKGDTFN